jgi:hypothetical protein
MKEGRQLKKRPGIRYKSLRSREGSCAEVRTLDAAIHPKVFMTLTCKNSVLLYFVKEYIIRKYTTHKGTVPKDLTVIWKKLDIT